LFFFVGFFFFLSFGSFSHISFFCFVLFCLFLFLFLFRRKLGALVAEFLRDPSCFVAVSSDFCHWGERFGFTAHDRSCGEIHESIRAMDERGMRVIAGLDPAAFVRYLADTGNTICGRNPITLLLEAVAVNANTEYSVRWVDYYQSSACRRATDSSVSYAAGLLECSNSEGEKIK
jgi:AmmeMemoRadiSam system protein B